MLHKSRKKNQASIELAPLIDIVFILLIFFAVSSSLISNNQSIPLDLPAASTTEKKVPTLHISANKEGHIFIDKQRVEIKQITPIIETAFVKDPKLSVVLSADKQLNYALIISILDHIRLSGCHNIGLEVEREIYK